MIQDDKKISKDSTFSDFKVQVTQTVKARPKDKENYKSLHCDKFRKKYADCRLSLTIKLFSS